MFLANSISDFSSGPGVRRHVQVVQRPPPGRVAGRPQQPANRTPQPPHRGRRPTEPKPFKVNRLGPPPELKETQGGDIIMDAEVINPNSSLPGATSNTSRKPVQQFQEMRTYPPLDIPHWTYPTLNIPPWTYPLLLTSGGHPCRPSQTCSLEDLTPPFPHCY